MFFLLQTSFSDTNTIKHATNHQKITIKYLSTNQNITNWYQSTFLRLITMAEGTRQHHYVDGKFQEVETWMQKIEDGLAAFKIKVANQLSEQTNLIEGKIQELLTVVFNGPRSEEMSGNGKGILGSAPTGPFADPRNTRCVGE
ncbi:hypothetical protein ACOSQ4_007492 [Xanthoceras sorbifolium]